MLNLTRETHGDHLEFTEEIAQVDQIYTCDEGTSTIPNYSFGQRFMYI